MNRCWREIGNAGDGTCPRLAEVIHCRNCDEYSRAGRALFDRPVSPEMSAEWTGALAAAKEQAARNTLSVVIFRVRSEWFAARTSVFAEVAERHAAHTVPFRTGGAFLGLVNINGELLLCVSMAVLLGLEHADSPAAVRPRTCVISRGRERVAFPVDEVLGVRRLDMAALESTPSTVAKAPTALTASLFTYHDRNVALLDEEKLFALLARCLSW